MRKACCWILLLLSLFVLRFERGISDDQFYRRNVNRYRYVSQTIFHYLPSKILERTRLIVSADVFHHREKNSCRTSFVQLFNVTVEPMLSNDLDTTQLTKEIQKIFDDVHRSQCSEGIDDEIKDENLRNSFFNYFLPTTVKNCTTSFDPFGQHLQKSLCRFSTAGLLTIERQLIFDKTIDQIQLKKPTMKTKKNATDVERLLQQICFKDDLNVVDELTILIQNQLDHQFLTTNIRTYSTCTRKWLLQAIIKVHRPEITEFLFHQDDLFIIDQHLNYLEDKIDDSIRNVLKKVLNSSRNFSEFLQLRLLLLIGDDQLLLSFALNSTYRLDYRCVALRSLREIDRFHQHFQTLFNDENESNEIRLIAFENLRSSFNMSNIERIQSKQIRFYLKSLSKESSLWLGQSGSYEFPFGTINVIFDESQTSFLPNVVQFDLKKNVSIDFYRLKPHQEILIVTNRISIERFATFDDFLRWIFKDRSIELSTLDGFLLHIDLQFKWFDENYRPWRNFFQKSTADITLKIHHGLGQIRTGFLLRFHLESNFQIHIRENSTSTSYLWFAKQKENTLFKIEQEFHPLFLPSEVLRKEFHSSSPKDFCYVVPHFDSKLCFTLMFDRLWSSSMAVRILSDDPSLVYNLTRYNQTIDFHIQHHQQPIRSMQFQHRYDEQTGLLSQAEWLTSIDRFDLNFHWQNESRMTCQMSKNQNEMINASGTYRYDEMRGISLNLTDISPRHLGQIFIDYTKNLTSINVERWRKSMSNLSDWRRVRFDVEIDQAFLFFKEHFSIDLNVNLKSFSFYATFVRNHRSKVQVAFIDEPSFFHQSLSINSSLIEFDYQTEIHYEDISTLNIQSSSTINSWSLWNVSYAAQNASRFQFQLNQWFGHLQIDYPQIEFVMNVSHVNLFRWNFYRKEEKKIDMVIKTPTSTYQIDGEIHGDYTDLRLDLPIVENRKIKSHCQINFVSDSNSSKFNATLNYRSIVFLRFVQHWTFLHRFLFQSETDLNVEIIKDSLLSFRSLIVFVENSTQIRFSNGSFHLPALFVAKPLHWNYQNQHQWFIQLFQWANATQTDNTMELTTNFGLRIFTIKSILTRISVGFEQIIFGHRFEFLLEIDRHWTISLLVNRRIRYDLKSIVSESSFRLTQTNIQTNQSRQLVINYHTDDQTLFRLEVLFSKYFSSFVNDFVIDLSLKNQTMKFLLHVPLFKKEFYSITWKRILSTKFFHFQGNLQSYFLRRRRLFHYDYDWHLDSFNHWTFDSRLSLFSSDPIQSNLTITNNYLWSGRYAVDYRLFIDHRRDLIRLHHEYGNVQPIAKIFVDLYLMNQNYLLDVNYSQINHSIGGFFRKNQRQHPLNGFWNSTSQTLQLNTDEFKSTTMITMSMIRSLIERDDDDERIGFLFETKRTESFTNDAELVQCNPYLIIQRRPRFFAIHYYTLNDGLTSMIYHWTSHSYFSWNFTGHGRSFLPLRKVEYDLRKNYLVRFHTTTYEYFAHYHIEKRQLTLRRSPVAEDADDCFDLRTKLYSNQTFFFHLQVINNHYRIIASPTGEKLSWALHGYFRRDSFNGSFVISRSDWWFSSHFNFNSSIFISTGSYVQLIPRSDPQFALEIRWKNQSEFVVQYAGWQSLFALKILFPFWNFDFVFTSQSIDTKSYRLNVKLNSQIDRNFSLLIDDEQFSLEDPNEEFQINGSSRELLFRHSLENQTTQFVYNADSIKIFTNHFGIFISNRTSETSRYIRFYHHQWKLNFTVFYYKSGRFHLDRSTFQTPIYDIHILHHPTDEDNRYVKIILELLPLQSSAFSLVRGRAFRLGYQTETKQMILEGNLGFTVEDLTHPRIILMNERWKLTYGYRKQDRLFIRWNLRLDSLNKTAHGRVTFQDPNDQFSSSIYSDVHGHIHDSFLFGKIRTFYASTTNHSQVIHVDVRIDTRVTREQNLSIDLRHELSETNLSFNIDHYPQRKIQISLKPNRLSDLETLLHLYANRSESQIYLLVVLRNLIHLNLTLPKSYPETGSLYSALFMDDDEYFDAKFEGSGLKLRTKEYLLNTSLTQFNLVDRNNDQTIASIIGQWLERNSSTGLITIVTPKSFPRKFVTTDSLTNQPTWLSRFRQYFVRNPFAIEFDRDLRHFFDQWKEDFIREHEHFSEHFFEAIKFDEDVQLTLEQLNSTLVNIINTCFQLGFDIENVIQEYMNNLTCLTNHRDLFYRNFTDVTHVAIESVIYQLVVHVNRTSNILNHLTHHSRSIGVLISYLINEITLEVYKEFSQFYLESKRYILRKVLEYSNDMELVINLSSLVFKSLTILASKDLQTLFSFINERFRRLIQFWLNSPIEYKVMRTIASQFIEWTDRIRFYLDDRFDFLLPDLRIYTPRFELNNRINQTFLFSWSKERNHSEHH